MDSLGYNPLLKTHAFAILSGRDHSMRFIVLLLSLSTMIFYGKAVAGMGGYLAGQGRPDLIILGLLAGTVSAVAALVLWKKHPNSFFRDDSQDRYS